MGQPRIAIIGTGLIGTSLGLALAAREGRNYEIVGYDEDRGRARTARKLGAIARDAASAAEAVEGAGLVIVAVPVLSARIVFEEIAGAVAEGAVVTDVCSTKASVIAWAESLLGSKVHFIGGHPMAGKERSGPEAASADLFRGATWAVVPAAGAGEEAVRIVLGLIEAVGAQPAYFDAAEHDQYVAAVSHVPILLSIGLFRMVRESPAWEDVSMLAGPAFKDLTRLASGDARMSADIMTTNREAVLHWLGRLGDTLEDVSRIVAEGGDRMVDLFVKASLDRDTFLDNPPVRRPPAGPETPSAGDQLMRLFAGGLYERYKDVLDRAESGEGPRNQDELKRKLGVKDRAR